MKKLLLFAALFATAMAGRAQSFTVTTTHNNESVVVENGSYLICTDYHDETDEIPEENGGYTYEVKLYVKGNSATTPEVTGTLLCGNYPTKEELDEDNDFVGETLYFKWGIPEICNNTTCFPARDGNLGQGNIKVATINPNYFVYHLMSAPSDLTSEYKTTIVSTTDPADSFECTLVFAPTKEAGEEFIANAGVNDIVADGDAAPVYYNLNGMKVANPSNGLYIVKRGSKVTKEVIR